MVPENDRHSLLVDLNVILDVLQRRQPHFESSAKVWGAIEAGRLRGALAAHSITTLFYLLSRSLSRPKATRAIEDLLEVFSIAAVDETVVREALSYGYSDFEDAVQMAAAARLGADFLITRNPKDFPRGPVAVLQPAEVPAILTELG